MDEPYDWREKRPSKKIIVWNLEGKLFPWSIQIVRVRPFVKLGFWDPKGKGMGLRSLL